MIKRIVGAALVSLLALGLASAPAVAAAPASTKPTGIKVKPLAGKANKKLNAYKGSPTAPRVKFSTCASPCFNYSGRRQTFSQPTNATGASADFSIHKPMVRSWDYHSLAEMAVIQTGVGGNNVVEAGWTVDDALNGGSTDPYFFVFFWINGAPQGYNTADFQLAGSPPVTPGTSVNSLVGTTKTIKWEFFGAGCGCTQGWWLSFNGSFVGVYPETLWGAGVFTSPLEVQNYGELVIDQYPSQSKMGNEHNATSANPSQGASISNLAVYGTGAPAAGYTSDLPLTDPVRWTKYNNSSTTFHYGGAGGNDGIVSTTTPSSNDCAAQGVSTDPTGWGAVCFYDNKVGAVPTIKRAQFDGGTGTACRANYGTADGGPPGTNPIRVVATVPYQRVQVYASANCTGTNTMLGGGVSTLAAPYSAAAHLSFKMTTNTGTGCSANYPTNKPSC